MKYDTAWLLHNKILRAMAEREKAYLLQRKIQMDDAYLGGERQGGKADRGSENKIPIVAAVSLKETGHPIHARITAVGLLLRGNCRLGQATSGPRQPCAL